MNIFQDFDGNHQRLDKPISPLKILKPMILGLMGLSSHFWGMMVEIYQG